VRDINVYVSRLSDAFERDAFERDGPIGDTFFAMDPTANCNKEFFHAMHIGAYQNQVSRAFGRLREREIVLLFEMPFCDVSDGKLQTRHSSTRGAYRIRRSPRVEV
jgi:hypothetical protein